MNPSQIATSTLSENKSTLSILPIKFNELFSNNSYASFICLFPLFDSVPTFNKPTRGLFFPCIFAEKTVPIAPKPSNCEGLQSKLLPTSKNTTSDNEPNIGPPIAGLSIPSSKPRISDALAIDAPVDPMLTTASTVPSFAKFTAWIIEAFGFSLNAFKGLSLSSITSSALIT